MFLLGELAGSIGCFRSRCLRERVCRAASLPISLSCLAVESMRPQAAPLQYFCTGKEPAHCRELKMGKTEGFQGLSSFPWVTGQPGAASIVEQDSIASICHKEVPLLRIVVHTAYSSLPQSTCHWLIAPL